MCAVAATAPPRRLPRVLKPRPPPSHSYSLRSIPGRTRVLITWVSGNSRTMTTFPPTSDACRRRAPAPRCLLPLPKSRNPPAPPLPWRDWPGWSTKPATTWLSLATPWTSSVTTWLPCSSPWRACCRRCLHHPRSRHHHRLCRLHLRQSTIPSGCRLTAPRSPCTRCGG